jgi:CRISPR system Cascade subunit CasE
MYFSRLQLRSDADPHKLVGLNGYREHQALWHLFDPDPQAARDFLFHRDDQSRRPVYYLVSRRMPADREGLWAIETKDYAPQLQAGQVLAFNLRANPVITRTDTTGKSRRNDLVMDAKKKLGWKDQSALQRQPMAQLVQEAGEQWLHSRQDRLGAHVTSIRSDGYRQHRSYKRGQNNAIRYSTLDLQGTLTVTDEDKLLDVLFHGIGHARAFGCGLLLVRRI